MGLDQYLYARKAIRAEDVVLRKVAQEHLAIPDVSVYTNKEMFVTSLVFQWRKSNMIHNWIENRIGVPIENLREYVIQFDILKELRDVCTKVVEHLDKGDLDYAREHLPTQDGFFWGDTEYGEWYRQDLVDTIEALTKILESNVEFTVEFIYQAWW